MLLQANKKAIQHSQQPSKIVKRIRPAPLSIPRLRLNAIDSPTFRPEPSRMPINDSLELVCAGMKLNSRGLRSPEKERKRLSGGISRTITLLKPLGLTAPVPAFSSLELDNSHILSIFRRPSENPEEVKLQKKASNIPSNVMLLNHDIRNDNGRQRTAFHASKQCYVGLHLWSDATLLPNIQGVLEEMGTCEVGSQKYFVSDLHLGYSFKNLMGEFGKLEQCTARLFLRQLIETMVRVHDNGYTHNRLSLDTIVHNGQGHLLVNFFKASMQAVGKSERLAYFHYFSPEMLESQRAHGSTKNDVWAIGNIALQFISKKSLKMSRYHPYNKASLTQSRFKQSILTQTLMQRITQNEYQSCKGDDYSSEAVDFISLCLKIREEQRPSMQELLQHPFLQ